MIEYIQGDIIKAFEELDDVVLLHQENCSSLHKKGFAKVLYDKYPQANSNSVMSQYFGNIYDTNINSGKYIINLYSQYYPGNPSNKPGKYQGFEVIDNYVNRIKALQYCLKGVVYFVDNLEETLQDKYTIIMPLIASGLAKDSTKEYTSDLDYFQRYIASVIEEYLEDYNVKVYYL